MAEKQAAQDQKFQNLKLTALTSIKSIQASLQTSISQIQSSEGKDSILHFVQLAKKLEEVQEKKSSFSKK